jgi:hypothetical protein
MLQEQADRFIKEEITDVDDYVNWIRWVSDAEQGRQAMCESIRGVVVPPLLQQPSQGHASSILARLQIVQIKDSNFDGSHT